MSEALEHAKEQVPVAIEDKGNWWEAHWGPLVDGLADRCGITRSEALLYQTALTLTRIENRLIQMIDCYNENVERQRTFIEMNERVLQHAIEEIEDEEPWKDD